MKFLKLVHKTRDFFLELGNRQQSSELKVEEKQTQTVRVQVLERLNSTKDWFIYVLFMYVKMRVVLRLGKNK